MAAVQENVHAYADGNGTAIAIGAGQQPAELREYAERNGITYPLLSDEDRRAVESYGVYHWFGLAAHNAAYGVLKPASLFVDRIGYALLPEKHRNTVRRHGFYRWVGLADHSLANTIARPATFIIDRLGVVRYMYVGSSQFDMVRQEELLERLRSLEP